MSVRTADGFRPETDDCKLNAKVKYLRRRINNSKVGGQVMSDKWVELLLHSLAARRAVGIVAEENCWIPDGRMN